MGLTFLAIPLIMLGIFIKPYTLREARVVFNLGRARSYCFAQSSQYA